mgnify:CR=1 FL=1
MRSKIRPSPGSGQTTTKLPKIKIKPDEADKRFDKDFKGGALLF